jgi:hypothetical protein
MTLHSSKKEGSSFPQLIGSRAQVWHGTAYKTTGGLTKRDLMMNHGRVVSRKKHFTAKKEKRLEKAGYFAKKGSFGFIKKDTQTRTRRRRRKMRGGDKLSTNAINDLNEIGNMNQKMNAEVPVVEETVVPVPVVEETVVPVPLVEEETINVQPTAGGRRKKRRSRGGKGVAHHSMNHFRHHSPSHYSMNHLKHH